MKSLMRFFASIYRLARIGWDLTIRLLIALLVPTRCTACDELLPRPAVFCASCAASVERCAVPGSLARFRYGGALKTAIVRFKYGDRPDLADALGHVLLRALPADASSKPRVVVPVPLHPTRLAERGFNQTALLGRVVSRKTGWPFLARALVRVRATSAQAKLGAAERVDNVAGAFTTRAPDAVRGRDVLLIDDVTTTGSTLRACRLALERAGARSVTCIALASQELASEGRTSP